MVGIRFQASGVSKSNRVFHMSSQYGQTVSHSLTDLEKHLPILSGSNSKTHNDVYVSYNQQGTASEAARTSSRIISW